MNIALHRARPLPLSSSQEGQTVGALVYSFCCYYSTPWRATLIYFECLHTAHRFKKKSARHVFNYQTTDWICGQFCFGNWDFGPSAARKGLSSRPSKVVEEFSRFYLGWHQASSKEEQYHSEATVVRMCNYICGHSCCFVRSFLVFILNHKLTTFRIWVGVIFTVAKQMALPQLDNGIADILKLYQPPTSTSPASPTWLEDFSAGIVPVECHSHNDYWHRVPLYEGLAAGCISTEADIWPVTTTDGQVELLVGHSSNSLNPARTLRSLYLNPLAEILKNQNRISSNNLTTSSQTKFFSSSIPAGVFSMAPNTSLILLLDFKTYDYPTLSTVSSQLEGLRSQGWLTHWTPTEGLVKRPLTVVASGNAPFEQILHNDQYRDIFYDAPLKELAAAPWNSNNSYYASSSLQHAVGKPRLGKFNSEQKDKIRSQVIRAEAVGLKSRYWDIPSRPVMWRNHIWEVLLELGMGVLNVDDLGAAARAGRPVVLEDWFYDLGRMRDSKFPKVWEEPKSFLKVNIWKWNIQHSQI